MNEHDIALAVLSALHRHLENLTDDSRGLDPHHGRAGRRRDRRRPFWTSSTSWLRRPEVEFNERLGGTRTRAKIFGEGQRAHDLSTPRPSLGLDSPLRGRKPTEIHEPRWDVVGRPLQALVAIVDYTQISRLAGVVVRGHAIGQRRGPREMLQAASIATTHVVLCDHVPAGFDSASDPIDVQPRVRRSNEDQAHVIPRLASALHELEGLATSEGCFDRQIAPGSKRRVDASQRDTARGEGTARRRPAPKGQCNLVGIDAIAHDNRGHQLDQRRLAGSVGSGYDQKTRPSGRRRRLLPYVGKARRCA